MKYTILPFALLLFFISCKNKNQESPVDVFPESTDLPEGFSNFYQQFHQDSTFQIDHIIFPLEGIPDNASEEIIQSGSFRWEKENWSLMRSVDYQMSEYKRDFIPLTKEMIMERILHKNGQFGMVRRFAIISGEWHLIYYAGINRLAQ